MNFLCFQVTCSLCSCWWDSAKCMSRCLRPMFPDFQWLGHFKVIVVCWYLFDVDVVIGSIALTALQHTIIPSMFSWLLLLVIEPILPNPPAMYLSLEGKLPTAQAPTLSINYTKYTYHLNSFNIIIDWNNEQPTWLCWSHNILPQGFTLTYLGKVFEKLQQIQSEVGWEGCIG